MGRVTKAATWALVMSLFSVFLLVLGYSIPFWLSYEAKEGDKVVKVNIGVWYLMTCEVGKANSCDMRNIKLWYSSTKNYTFPTAAEPGHIGDIIADSLGMNTAFRFTGLSHSRAMA